MIYSVDAILDELQRRFPDAKAELDFSNTFELTVAVILSAQTTDVAVNKVTPALFQAYPTVYNLAQAELKHVESYIQSLGLYRNKAKSLVTMAQQVVLNFNGEIPSQRKHLLTLAGIGPKTANVILSVAFNVPAIAVDTHVARVSKRLKLAKEYDDVNTIERKLKRKIKRSRWSDAHHLFIFFGRYHCFAQNPKCNTCPFTKQCRYFAQHKKTLR